MILRLAGVSVRWTADTRRKTRRTTVLKPLQRRTRGVLSHEDGNELLAASIAMWPLVIMQAV